MKHAHISVIESTYEPRSNLVSLSKELHNDRITQDYIGTQRVVMAWVRDTNTCNGIPGPAGYGGSVKRVERS